MIELSGDIPFLWRLSAESSEGYCSVSMVVPCPPDTEITDLTIETSVLSLSSDSTRSETEETLEWNQEDISLFLRLVNQKRLGSNQALSDTVRVDLTDPDIIDIEDEYFVDLQSYNNIPLGADFRLQQFLNPAIPIKRGNLAVYAEYGLSWMYPLEPSAAAACGSWHEEQRAPATSGLAWTSGKSDT